MLEWIENGSKLAWLIDFEDKMTYIFSSENEMQIIAFDKLLLGGNILPNFEINLSNFFL